MFFIALTRFISIFFRLRRIESTGMFVLAPIHLLHVSAEDSSRKKILVKESRLVAWSVCVFMGTFDAACRDPRTPFPEFQPCRVGVKSRSHGWILHPSWLSGVYWWSLAASWVKGKGRASWKISRLSEVFYRSLSVRRYNGITHGMTQRSTSIVAICMTIFLVSSVGIALVSFEYLSFINDYKLVSVRRLWQWSQYVYSHWLQWSSLWKNL